MHAVETQDAPWAGTKGELGQATEQLEMSLDYIAKHEATSLLKFKLTMWAKKKHGSVGFKGERVFSCSSKSEKCSVAPKRTTPIWWPNPWPVETIGGDSFPHDGLLSLNSDSRSSFLYLRARVRRQAGEKKSPFTL